MRKSQSVEEKGEGGRVWSVEKQERLNLGVKERAPAVQLVQLVRPVEPWYFPGCRIEGQ
jgi:hypothetical protein